MNDRRAGGKNSKTDFQLMRGRTRTDTDSKKAESRQGNDADGLLQHHPNRRFLFCGRPYPLILSHAAGCPS